MKILLLVLAFFPALLFAQSRKEKKALEAQQKADQVIVSNLTHHIQSLASGNATGQNTPSVEAREVEYISSQFKLIGLQPKGTDGFVQSFKLDDGKKIDPSTYLKVNDKLADPGTDYFPLSYSSEKMVKGKPAMALRERGVPWFIDLNQWVDDGLKIQGNNIHEAIKKEISKVAGKGATALFLYNSGTTHDSVAFNPTDKTTPSLIPVIYITPTGMKKYFSDHSEVLDIQLNIAFNEDILSGTNVAGYLDNAAPSTVVITAHYQPAVTEDASKAAAVADGNASGIATLIELAKTLSASKGKNNNYLFLALSGVDKGRAAESYWLGSTPAITSINYVVNLDLPGSVADSKKLMVHGYKSSPIWRQIFTSVPPAKVELAIDSSNSTNELIASFYKKEIPVLSFSTAAHTNYTTDSDDGSKINYGSTLQILKFIDGLIEATDIKGRVAFAKDLQTAPAGVASEQAKVTVKADESEAVATRATVSLGVIPDKTNSADGLKISGVTPRKLASKLGLQAGDVLTHLGTYQISDLKSYMQALSNFKTGDKTTLRIKRGADDKEFAVAF